MADRRAPLDLPSLWHRPWASGAREVLADPNIIAAIFPAAATAAGLSLVLVGHWTIPELVFLWSGIVVGLVFTALPLALRWRLPRWGLHLEAGIGNLYLAAVVIVAATQQIDMANLFLLSATAAILLFSVPAAAAHVGASAVYYAAVLAFGPATPGSPIIAWLAIFGTTAVVGAVAVGLVGVLRLAATADPLTGLANRRAWDDRLDQEMQRSRRTGTTLTIAMIDLNGFKAINDREGHAAGDQLLKTLARAWQAEIRGGVDFLARIGGDEFAALTSGPDEMAMRRLIKRFEEATPAVVSFSAGEATWDHAERDSDLLHRADLAMYTAKLKYRRDANPHIA
ncbi:MAG: GGDEF domain-containing protein [Pseudolysinimonas sp.]